MKVGLNTTIWHPELSNIGDCEIGENCKIHSHVWIGNGVKIGNNCKVQAFSFIPTGVIINDDVFVGPRVTFTNDKHPPSQGKSWAGTIVERGAIIGAGAVILPGITIGEGSIVGAGAVVTKNVERGQTVIGNPAKCLKK